MLRQAWEAWDERVAMGPRVWVFGVGVSSEGAGTVCATAHSVCQDPQGNRLLGL